ncbi:MAG TPA: hypothetical protein VD815_03955 [Candidatus Saccharimonadales bacterium]|nr:hypothetical protein [Candidatus Saccharimonadales bacterium]
MVNVNNSIECKILLSLANAYVVTEAINLIYYYDLLTIKVIEINVHLLDYNVVYRREKLFDF